MSRRHKKVIATWCWNLLFFVAGWYGWKSARKSRANQEE